jgi:hypothetical protein
MGGSKTVMKLRFAVKCCRISLNRKSVEIYCLHNSVEHSTSEDDTLVGLAQSILVEIYQHFRGASASLIVVMNKLQV